jgi:hypothetical protein
MGRGVVAGSKLLMFSPAKTHRQTTRNNFLTFEFLLLT